MQIKKTAGTLVLCALMLAPVSLQAATCRAATAAETGSEAGYNRAKTAAEAWYERESSASSKLQECLDQIRSISLTLPSFISLSEVLDQIADQLCSTVTDEINSYIPSTIDPWDDLTS